MPSSLTIAAVSQPRNRPPTQPRAPLTAAEKKEKKRLSEEQKEAMDEDIAQWHASTRAKAIELGQKYNKTERYFLDIFFQGGARMVHSQEKVNAYNAFKAEKAAELRAEGRVLLATELHEEYFAEYEAMTEEEKKDLVTRYAGVKAAAPKLRRDTPRARMRDVSNTCKNLEMLMYGLSYRVGVEGFFCVVRNSTDFHMNPQWYFTSQALERYMPLAVRKKWNTGDVGTRIEAFAVAGCDTLST
ncbi:hypothetical protein C8F04DRAFT_947546 [Mycena alexandri]|uniref:Uncharacterized protein n=1 Tax=Mycena alexandri TaxID=1745969 RepID=A0AAD6TA55_9AGAR|nr:hypothetical protein C8F04DRAFT_947546 [Mycena alexandri]